MAADKLFKAFEQILRIRLIETEISKRYKDLKMRCPVHLSIGQESVAVGVCINLKKSDEVVTAHRSHAHYLAKGGDLKKMIAELHGKETGCAKGLGGSMHLIDIKKNISAAVPIVGSTLPIGVGKAWANKFKNNNNIVVIFFGDGATEEGAFFESLDFAALHQLRVIFVCENNNYSVYSDRTKRQFKKRSVCKIASAIGIKSLKISDHNFEKINLKTKKIVQSLRKKSEPYLLEINTFRYFEHCGPNKDDQLNYRSSSELKFWKKKDQIENLQLKLIKTNVKYKKKIIKLKKKIIYEINDAFNFAIKSRYPKKSLLFKYIFK